MKRVVYFLMVSLMTITLSCNQGSQNNSQQNFNPGGGMRPGTFDPEAFADRQVEQMKEELDLTNDQSDQMHDIMMEGIENMQQMREEMQDQGGGFEGMREQMRKMREDQDQKIKAILSDEQWEKYEVFQEEMRSRRRQGGFGGQR
jgi:protein CpxP